MRKWQFVLFLSLLIFSLGRARAVNLGTAVVVIAVAPNVPSDLTAVSNAPTQVSLAWTINSLNEDGFSIERKTGIEGIYFEVATVGTGIATYTDNGVSAGTIYFYRVRAFIGGSYSAYSNEASVTTSSNPPPPGGGGGSSSGGGGGGGGGGYTPPVVSTNVTISGAAYPLSTITILKDGQVALKTIAGPDGNFYGQDSGLSEGNYAFYIYAEDANGNRSAPFTFSAYVTQGATTEVSGIFLSPTIGIDKSEVKKGNTLVIFGQSAPSTKVIIQVDSAIPLFFNATSASSGAYVYDLNTGVLDMGGHVIKSQAAQANLLSGYSIAQGFMVGDRDVAAAPSAKCPAKGNLNGDCKVDLVDFSILAYWYGRANPPAQYLLDGTKAIDLTDFSIMAFYWTG